VRFHPLIAAELLVQELVNLSIYMTEKQERNGGASGAQVKSWHSHPLNHFEIVIDFAERFAESNR
jgi:hypothetical protein